MRVKTKVGAARTCPSAPRSPSRPIPKPIPLDRIRLNPIPSRPIHLASATRGQRQRASAAMIAKQTAGPVKTAKTVKTVKTV